MPMASTLRDLGGVDVSGSTVGLDSAVVTVVVAAVVCSVVAAVVADEAEVVIVFSPDTAVVVVPCAPLSLFPQDTGTINITAHKNRHKNL